jgi:hypothetical protein
MRDGDERGRSISAFDGELHSRLCKISKTPERDSRPRWAAACQALLHPRLNNRPQGGFCQETCQPNNSSVAWIRKLEPNVAAVLSLGIVPKTGSKSGIVGEVFGLGATVVKNSEE